MTVLQKITNSKNPAAFTLYLEGLFYKCYNEDAMVFHQRVKPFKITSKYVKSAGTMVLSLGFPSTLIENQTFSIAAIADMVGANSWKEEPHGLVFQLSGEIKSGYDTFQDEFTKAKQNLYTDRDKTENNGCQNLINKIRNYDLANHTPMQGMAFIQELTEPQLQ